MLPWNSSELLPIIPFISLLLLNSILLLSGLFPLLKRSQCSFVWSSIKMAESRPHIATTLFDSLAEEAWGYEVFFPENYLLRLFRWRESRGTNAYQWTFGSCSGFILHKFQKDVVMGLGRAVFKRWSEIRCKSRIKMDEWRSPYWDPWDRVVFCSCFGIRGRKENRETIHIPQQLQNVRRDYIFS